MYGFIFAWNGKYESYDEFVYKGYRIKISIQFYVIYGVSALDFKIKLRHKFIGFHKCDKNITFVEAVKYIVYILEWTDGI